MKLQQFSTSQIVPFHPDVVWRFFSDASNLAALTPPAAGFASGPVDGPVYPGQILTHRVTVLPGIRILWVSEILHVESGRSFVDGQQAGPFRFWRHRHGFREVPEGTLVEDTVHWALPLDPLSRVALPLVRRKLRELFEHRSRLLPAALARFADGPEPVK